MWLLCVLKDKIKLNDIKKLVGDSMFKNYKYKVEDCKEVEVYRDDIIEHLYTKVHRASNLFARHTMWNKDSQLILHSDDFVYKVEKNMFDLFLLPIVIHNKMYRFVVDTGAQISGIMDRHKDLIQTYKKELSIGIKSVSGALKKMDTICLDRFYAGSMEILNHTLVVLCEDDFKLPFVNKNIVGFDGILGWDILSQIDFELDDVNHRFSMLKSDDKFTYCNLIPAMFPIVIVQDENKKPAIFGIDSGAQFSWMHDLYCQKSNLKINKGFQGFNMGVHGIEKAQVQKVEKCRFAFYKNKITMENVRCGQTNVFPDLALDGIFGNEIFKNRRIQFLNSKGIVRIL